MSEQDVAPLIDAMRRDGKAAWTIRGVLTPLGLILDDAERRSRLIAANPMRRLKRGARPSVGRREMRVLSSEEIAKLISKAPARYQTAIATAAFTGLRLGELLGLRWGDVDFDAELISVRRQVDRRGAATEPKTPQAIRQVILMPALAKMLREHRAASRFSKAGDYVFASHAGTPLHYRNLAQRGLAKAVEDAGLDGDGLPKLRWHDLRHGFASLLIAQGANVVFVSRQLGHASPDIMLRVYAHLFDRAEHAQRARDALEGAFGAALAGSAQAASGRNEAQKVTGELVGEVVEMQAFRS